MLLTRFALVPLLVAGTLPCFAQLRAAKQPANSAPFKIQSSTCVTVGGPPARLTLPDRKLCAQLEANAESALKQFMAEKSSACYSIRDYRFTTDPSSNMPMLKDYTTCESASLFHMQEVTIAPRR